MSRICFDITGILRYARANDRVSGIQRVELNLIRHTVRTVGAQRALGLIREASGEGYRLVHLGFLAGEQEFSASSLLLQTGSIRSGRWPDIVLVKKHLHKYRHRKVHRGAKKAQIYLEALVARDRLTRKGLLRDPALDSHEHMQLGDTQLLAGDTYVRLGADWEDVQSHRVAQTHRDNGGRVVQMVHDLIPLVRPDLHEPAVRARFEHWLHHTTRYTTLFLCISEHTKADLQTYLKTAGVSIPISVVLLAHEFHGYARGVAPPPPSRLRAPLSQFEHTPFILCVGTLEVRKNLLTLLKAWSLCRRTAPNAPAKLVLAGKRGWGLESFDEFMRQTNALDQTVWVLQGTTDAELAWLYGKSLFTVYPSMYEGWGLPVGESLWFGTPCIASSATSIPEVGLELALYFSPEDVQTLAARLTALLLDHELISALRTAIRSAPLRTWSQFTSDALRQIAVHANE